jgi:DNA-binding Xre family transcriptional regulator
MMETVPDLFPMMDVLPAERKGEPDAVIVPARLWNRLPPALRERFPGIRAVLGPIEEGRPRAVRAWLVPADRYGELHEAIEDAIDIEIAEEGDAELERERAARARIGAEPLIPGEIVAAELAGAHPIAAWRKHRGMTQADLAASVGIDRGYLALIERRARAGSTDTLARIARALGCLVEDLLEGIGAEATTPS